MPVPWERLRTLRPEPYSFSFDHPHLTAHVHDLAPASSQLNLDTGAIRLQVYRRAEALVAPWELKVDVWSSARPPILCMHPFGLLHLMATGQVDPREAVVRLRGLSGPTQVATLAFWTPGKLHHQLRLRRFAVKLATSYSLTTDAGA